MFLDKRKKDFYMINSEENKKIWVEKIKTLMDMGGKSNWTFINYISGIRKFLNFYDEKTDFSTILEEEILEYIKKNYLDLNRCSDTVNLALCSIKYLYSVCFKIELNHKLLPYAKREQLIPSILPKEDFIKIFNKTKNLKHKCWLLLAFASGLRESEVVSIKIENIYANEHKIKVYGKRNKERYTILPDITIKCLRTYCKYNHITNKTGYLFKGTNGLEHNAVKCPGDLFRRIKKEFALPETITFHSLRHSFATYYLMNGGNLITLQTMMGHTSIQTTRRYIHYSQDFNHLEGIRYVK